MPIRKFLLFGLLCFSASLSHAASRWIIYSSTPNLNCTGFAGGGHYTTAGAETYCADDFSVATATAAVFAAVVANAPLTYSGGIFGVDSSSATLQGNTFNAANKLMRLNSAGTGVLHIVATSSNVAPGLVYLSTETSGNYVGALNTAAPLTGGNVGQQNAQLTIGVDATVTVQGNTFNSTGKLMQLNSTSSGVLHTVAASSSVVTALVSLSTETTGNYVGALNTAAPLTGGNVGQTNAQLTIGVDASSVTLQGNSFNAASKLLQLSASALVPNAQIDGSSVTKQGNTFNGASQLVQTNGSTQLPAISGVNLTNLNGSNVASGTVGSARLPADTVYNDVNTTFTSSNTFTGISTFTANVNISNDIYTGGAGLTDYSGTSTIVGWASFTTKTLQYKKVGKTIHVYFDLRGTSNSTSSTFTLPFASSSSLGTVPGIAGALDNGTGVSTPSQASLGTGSSTVTVYKTFAGDGWTASGTKIIYGVLVYESN